MSALDTWQEIAPGLRRRIHGHLPEMMVVEVEFAAGAVGDLHSHPHVQASYVAAGRFAVTIAGETREYAAGESFLVGPNLVHGLVALEAGRLIDVFTPRRESFL